MKQYEYMITFAFPGGFGRTSVMLKKEIHSMEDIRNVDKLLISESSNVTDILTKLNSQLYAKEFKLLRVHDNKRKI